MDTPGSGKSIKIWIESIMGNEPLENTSRIDIFEE
jgi:hypothetical protein